jgi:hypothetical protein
VWQHLTWTVRQDTAQLCINGELIDSISEGPYGTTLDVNITLGAFLSASGPSSLYSGAIEDLRIYNQALPGEAVAFLAPQEQP